MFFCPKTFAVFITWIGQIIQFLELGIKIILVNQSALRGHYLNSKIMNYDRDNYYDQEVMFDYEDKTYFWQGDYSITSWGEDESESAPAYGEIEVEIINTYSFSCFQDESEVIPTPSLLMQLEIAIERNY